MTRSILALAAAGVKLPSTDILVGHRQTPGAIGYVELAYAKQNHLLVGQVKNRAGNYVKPSLEGATAAATEVAQSLSADTDFRIAIVDPPGADAYPISSFTWLLVYKTMPDGARAKELTRFVTWALADGEKVESPDYAPLPPNVAALEMRQVQRVEHPGRM
jgi:phosphate transport system substrate-binding protein